MMKKLLAATLAAAMALSVSIPTFAADPVAADKTINLTTITGQPVFDTGVQVSKTPSTGTPTDSIEPNQAIYFALPQSVANWVGNSSNFRLSSRKVKNGKLIKSIKLVEKRLTTSSAPIYQPAVVNPTGGTQIVGTPVGNSDRAGYDWVNGNTRNMYLEVVLNDTTSADEFKVEFTATLSAKKAPAKDGVLFYGARIEPDSTVGGTATAGTYDFAKLAAGNRLTLNGSFYVANKADSGSTEVTVGTKGMTIKPVGNDDNEIVFENEETLATMRFRANSNPAKFYAKLSTRWTNALLAKFRNTDAVIRAFSPATIDATSRATLFLNNPFDDSIDPENVYIYAVSSKGVISDVTRSFSYDEDEDAFYTRTRTLGTWIISDTKVKLR